MASDWLAAVLQSNQVPGLKIILNSHNFQQGHFLIIQAPGKIRPLTIWYFDFEEKEYLILQGAHPSPWALNFVLLKRKWRYRLHMKETNNLI